MGKGGGGGGQPAPSSQTVTQTSIPEYARPYVETMLGKSEALTDINQNPYQNYGGQRIADFNQNQQNAFANVFNQAPASQLGSATNLAGQAGLGAIGMQGQAGQLGQEALGYGATGQLYGGMGAQQALQRAQQTARQAGMYGGMGAGFGAQAAGMAPTAQQFGQQAADIGLGGLGYGAMGAGFGGRGVQAAEQGFGAGEQFARQATDPYAMQAYMSPYMQNAVDYQKSQAIRDFDIGLQAQKAQAVGKGAFGGSRQAIVEAEGRRSLGNQLAGIQATGTQKAFEDAQRQQQFGAQLGLQGLQAGYGGLGLGMQGAETGLRGLGTAMQGQQAGLQGLGQAGQLFGQGIQGAQAGLQGVGAQQAAGQLGLQGTAQGMQGAGYGLQGVTAATGAGQLGLQGLGQATSAASTLGQLGQTQFGQEQAISAEQQKVGAIQQAQAQQGLDLAYQDFLSQRNYPYQQLAFQSDMLRGLPLSQSAQSMYTAPPSMGSQLGGLGMSALGIYGMSGGFKAKGGMVGKGYAEGGQIGYAKGGDISMMSTEQLIKMLDNPTITPIEAEMIQKQLMLRQRMTNNPEAIKMLSGIAAIPTGNMVPEGMAGGGIVAFADNPDQPVRAGMPGRRMTEEDRLFLEQNPYMRRSRAIAELGGSVRDAFTNPSNYNPIDLYNRNIGKPFAEAIDRFKNADLTSTFRTGQKARTGEIPMFVGNELTPKGRMVAEGRMKPEENVLDVIKREREARGFTPDQLQNQYVAQDKQEGRAPSAKSGNVSTAKAKPKAKADEKAVPAEVKGTPEEPLYAKYEKMLMDEREAAKANKEQALYARLVEAGLGTMAGTSQYGLENLARGTLPAVKGYGEDVKGARAEERTRIKDLLGIEGMRQEAKRSEQDMSLKERTLAQDKDLREQMIQVQLIAAQKPNQTEQIIALGKRAGLSDREIMSQIIGSAKDPDTSARNIAMKAFYDSPVLQAQYKNDVNAFLKAQGIGAGAAGQPVLNYVPGKGIQ
jgi:hypothetical protein